MPAPCYGHNGFVPNCIKGLPLGENVTQSDLSWVTPLKYTILKRPANNHQSGTDVEYEHQSSADVDDEHQSGTDVEDEHQPSTDAE
jgi:ABC-type Zn2+ transport system substrate-binding protein/surface adhesin